MVALLGTESLLTEADLMELTKKEQVVMKLMIRQTELLRAINDSVEYSNKLLELAIEKLECRQQDNSDAKKAMGQNLTELQRLLKQGGSKEDFEAFLASTLQSIMPK